MNEATSAWEIILNLRKMQEIDNKAREVSVERDQIKGRLDDLKNLLERGRADLEARRRKISEAEAWHKEQKVVLDEEHKKIGRLKAQLGSVSKNKEYMAIQRELEILRQTVAEKEEELERFTEALNSHRAAVQEEQEKLNELESQAGSEDNATQKTITSFERKINKITKERESFSAKIPKQVVRRYDRVRVRREGKAIVAVSDGRCSGCHMRIPPQLFNVLLRRNSLETCPSCNRYIFVEKEDAEE